MSKATYYTTPKYYHSFSQVQDYKIALILVGIATQSTLTTCYDEEYSKQALTNLRGNAVQYSLSGSNIHVRLQHTIERASEVEFWPGLMYQSQVFHAIIRKGNCSLCLRWYL